MQAAGFHFGHDASGTLVDGSGLRRFLDKERRSRVKHAIGLSADDLREILAGAPGDTLVGLSSTQGLPLFPDPGVGLTLDGGKPANAAAYFQRLPADHPYQKFITWMPDLQGRDGVLVEEGLFPHRSRLNEGFNRSYEALGMVAGQFPRMAGLQQRDGTLTLDGQAYPARFYQHHFLHALYAAWTGSPTRKSLVITGDGGIGPSFWGGGVYFWTPGQQLLPVTPSDAWLGWFYDAVSAMVGFGQSGGAGKLMGLAPYGRPLYLDAAMVGTRLQVSDGYRLSMPQIIQRWLGKFGIDSGQLPTWDLFRDRAPTLIADIAASAQLIIELNIQELAKAAVAIAHRADFGFETITLSGGVALNCPANSNLAVTLNAPVLVPPAINDEGLSIAAAVAAYFDRTGQYPAAPADYAEAAYIGSDVSQAEVEAAAAAHGFTRDASRPAVADAVDALLRGDAVGVCVGRAEVGPRALGHRSILANPGLTGSWEAVNRLKLREPWRPFAPAVLKERAADYFDRGPEESRFMLFNYRCNSKLLPATTHYDHSSRVQQVSPQTGILYEVLLGMEQRGAPPVVLNTSFNGPGVPIVDSAEDAFAEAAKLGLRHILTDYGFFSAG